MDYVTTHEHSSNKFILLVPGNYPPRPFPTLFINYEQYLEILPSILASEIVAIDFETKGSDCTRGDFQIVGVGLAWDTGNCYFPATDIETTRKLLDTLYQHKGLIAHNVYFDGGAYLAATGRQPQWHMCTYAALANLANEGYLGVSWGLKWAQVELLGWLESNEGELDEWLVINRYYKGVRRVDESPEGLMAQYRTGILKPEKSEMWRAPTDILGKYCILDAESTYLLYRAILRPALQKFQQLYKFMVDEFMPLIQGLIEQKSLGIPVDRAGLLERREYLLKEIERARADFRNHLEVRDVITQIEQETIHAHFNEKIPKQFNVGGEESKVWRKWKDNYDRALRGEHPDFIFNTNSTIQMAELLYNRLGYQVHVYTEKGKPATGNKAYRKMGEIGSILLYNADVTKELTYIEKYIELTQDRTTIHPSFRTPGTATGRLSSKEPNLQQVPKTKAVMSLFHANPGSIWVDIDFAALEAVVAAEFSQDPNLLALYGNGVPENDIHLFVASQVPGEMGQRIRATGYTAINPPKGSVSRAKKECKHERSIAKTVVYACQFGAGVRKVMQTLENDDVYLDFDQVETIHSTYWNTFARLKDFSRSLYFEWKRNGGYILNGMGRPMAVPEEFSKDLLSRFIQSTGHDILVTYINILIAELDRSGILWRPMILDWHDATTIEVPIAEKDRAVAAFNLAMNQLNEKLQGTIQLRGIPTVGITLADVKEPEA